MIGRTLGHYRIVAEISRGGMGVVYRATDLHLNRDVALKVLPEALLHDPERRERLLQEARAASAVEHPHIAVIHAVDEVDDVTFIAMELIRGEKLSDILGRGPLPQSRAVDLAIEITEGLARAHEAGIIHRDLKPANVMITDDGHAKIIDFGLAKLVEPLNTNASTATLREITDAGVVMGTAAYMSPEQARGLRLDHRSDVFSFGVVLYEMLTGRPAFRGESQLDTLNAILTHAVPPLPATSGAVEITHELQRIIAKATAKDPADRYQGMKDLVVDLRTVRRAPDSGSASGATAAAARALSAGPPAPKRRRLIALAALVAAGGLAWSIWWANRPVSSVSPSGKPAVAVLYFDNNTGDASLDWMRTGLTDMLVTDLSQSTEFEVLGTDRVQQILRELRRSDDAVIDADVVQAIAKHAAVDSVVLGSYVKAGDVIRINARLQNAATGRVITSERVEGSDDAGLFALVDELTRRFRTRLAHAIAPAMPLVAEPGAPAAEAGLDRGLTEITTSSIEAYRYYAEGIHAHERGMTANALPLIEKALEIDPEFAMAHAKIAVLYSNLRDFVKRDAHAQRAVALVDRLTPRERYYIEGFYYSLRFETYGRSIEAYTQGLARHPEHQASRHNLALMLIEAERFDEAIAHNEELIRRGTSNPTTSENQAELYIMVGNVPRARQVAEDYLRRFPDSGPGIRSLAMAHVAAGELDVARALYDKAAALNPADQTVWLGRRVVALLGERWADAEAIAAEMRKRSPFERFVAEMTAGTTAAGRGRSKDALMYFDRAATNNAIAPFNRAAARNIQAGHLIRWGDYAQALALLRSSIADARDRNPEFANLQLTAVAQAALGRDQDAAATLAELERRAATMPGTREARRLPWARGEIALIRGDAGRAAAELGKAASMMPAHGWVLGPPTGHMPIWIAAATASIRAGRDDDAVKYLESIQSGFERTFDMEAYARSFYLLGQVYERRGDPVRARQQYARFLELWRDGDLERGWVAEAQKKLTR